MFTFDSLSIAVLVFIARLFDVGLGTIRHAMIMRGRRQIAFVVAFFEALIWVYAVSRVVSDVQDPLTSLAFALGFASGTFVGMTLESLVKIGEQVVRIFSRQGELVADTLRANGFRVTVFDGRGRDGAVNLLFVQTKRRNAEKIAEVARRTDPACFIVLDDIRTVHLSIHSADMPDQRLSS